MALVLNRKKDESILFDTSDGVIHLKVHKVDRGYISLVIESPKGIKILRMEIADEALLTKFANQQLEALHSLQ